MMQIDTDIHEMRGSATLAAIHNRLDLLENQVADLERALATRDLLMKRARKDDEPIILPPGALSVPARTSAKSIVPLPVPRVDPSALPIRNTRRWQTPVFAGASLLAIALLAVEVVG